MKNGLLRFYLLFMFVSLALFSCENHEFSQTSGPTGINIERRPDNRRPIEPNGIPGESQKGKKPKRSQPSRSSNWC